jgi:hypothetical protein
MVPDDNSRAAELFQQAIDLDPDYAMAYAIGRSRRVTLHGYGDFTPAISQGRLVDGYARHRTRQ